MDHNRVWNWRNVLLTALLVIALAGGCRSRSDSAAPADGPAAESVVDSPEEEQDTEPAAPAEDEAATPAAEIAPTESANKEEEEAPPATEPPSEAPAETGAVVQGACGHPYYPIRDGAVYRYQMTAPDLEPAVMTIAFTVTGADSFVTTQSFSGVTTETTWQCTPDGLLRTDLGIGGMDIPGLAYSVDGVTGVTFPPTEQLTEGATWQNSFNMSGQMSMEGMSLNVTMDSTTDNVLAGFESVTTPAGTYDAARVEATTTIQIAMDMGDVPGIPAMDTTTTMWLAEGVGMVKSESADPMGGESTMELIALE